MGRAAKRNLHKRMSLIDKFEAAASSGGVNEAQSIYEDETQIIVPVCPYLTSIITVMVGSPLKEFKVHSGVLSMSRILASKCQALGVWHELFLRDIDPSVFELALCYMYGKDYKDYFSTSNPMPKKSDARAAAFKRHSLLYCFARRYELDGLTEITIKNIKDLGQVDYPSVFDGAKEAYKHLPDDESWFRDCFKVETKRALRECRDLVDEYWVINTFREGNGNFTVDLFTALTEGYEKIISTRLATPSGPNPSPKLSRWFSPNLSHGAYAASTNSCSTDWAEGDTAPEEDSATDATSGDEIIRVEGSLCVEDYTLDGESVGTVEAYPEVELAQPVEDPVVAEASCPIASLVNEEVACYEDPPQEDSSVTPCEKAVDINAVPAATQEVEVCSIDLPTDDVNNWSVWGTWGSSRKTKKDKKRGRGQYNFIPKDDPAPEPALPAEEAVAEATPGEPIAEEADAEEVVAEEAVFEEVVVEEATPEEPIAEEAVAEEAVTEEAVVEEAAAEEADFEEPVAKEAVSEELPAEDRAAEQHPLFDLAAECETSDQAIELIDLPTNAPADEPAPEPPAEATTEHEHEPELIPKIEPEPEPYWDFSCSKGKKKGKKARVVLPSTSPPNFQPPEPDISAARTTEAFPLYQDLSATPQAAPEDESAFASALGLKYSSLPIFKYPTCSFASEAKSELESEPQPESSCTPCMRRGFHLARYSRWTDCAKCRAEMSTLAQKMARDCNPGWGNFT